MTKNFCKQCGSALTKAEGKFCTTCGATVDGADSEDLSNQETVALPGEQRGQTDFATEVIPAITPPSTNFATEVIPAITPPSTNFATEVIPAITPPSTDFATEVIPAITPPSFETEEISRVVTARAEERATEVIEAIATTPAAQRLKIPEEPAPAIQPTIQPSGQQSGEKSGKKSGTISGKKSGGQKKLALAAAFGVVAVVAAAILFINSRKSPEAQAETLLAENVASPTPAQSSAQQSNPQDSQPSALPSNQPPNQPSNRQLGPQSGAGAKNQAQLQTKPQPGTSVIDIDIKPPTARNDVASKPQQQTAAKPTPAAPGISAAEHQKQGTDYLNKRLYQEALREFEYVRKLDPGNKDVYYLIGSAYNGMNQLQQALEAYRQCTSGMYANVAQSAVKNVEKKLKINAK